MNIIELKSLSEKDQQLLTEAQQALQVAFNPHSKQLVGGALRVTDGSIYTAGNFFNSTSGVNICAERSTVIVANAQKNRDAEAIAIVSDFEGIDTPILPCGVCRQFLFGLVTEIGHDITILAANKNLTKITVTSVKALLPDPFFNNE